MKQLDPKELFDRIMESSNTPEMKRFSMKEVNDHLILYQDFNKFWVSILLSHSDEDEHNWIFGLHLIFWGFEFSWNGRRNK